MKDTAVTIKVDDGKTQRLLRQILHQQEEIFKVLDSFDELSDIIDQVKANTELIQGIVPNSEE